MSMRYIAILAIRGSAGGKRLALLKGQSIPLQFAGVFRTLNILALIFLLVELLVIFFRILIQ